MANKLATYLYAIDRTRRRGHRVRWNRWRHVVLRLHERAAVATMPLFLWQFVPLTLGWTVGSYVAMGAFALSLAVDIMLIKFFNWVENHPIHFSREDQQWISK